MTLKIFEKNLSAYGSNFHLWDGCSPDELRAFIAENDQAMALYIEAQALDAQLDDFFVPEASMEIATAAKAQIIRDDVRKVDAQIVIKPKPSLGSMVGLIPKPAYALAVVFCFFLVFGVANQRQATNNGSASFDLAAVESLLTDLEQLEEKGDEQQELMMAFAEIEQEQEIDLFIDAIIIDVDDAVPDDVWDYFNQEG